MTLDPALVDQALRILPAVVWCWVRGRRLMWLYDEVLSEALFALPEVLRRYKPDKSALRGYLFSTVIHRITDWHRESGDKSVCGARVPRLCDRRKDWDMAFHRPRVRIGYTGRHGECKASFAEDVLLATHDPGYDRVDLRDLVKTLLLRVSRREREIILLYYFESLTFREIGEVLNLGESRICQLHNRAMCRIRASAQLRGGGRGRR